MKHRDKILVAGMFAAAITAGCGTELTDRPVLHGSDSIQPTTPTAPYESGVLLVVLNAGDDADDVCTDHNVTLAGDQPDGRTFRLVLAAGETPETKEAELLTDPRVAAVSPNYLAEDSESRQSSMAFDEGFLDKDQFLRQASLKTLGLGPAHQIATGEGVTVAILDTGADSDHEVLAGRIDPASYDFVDNDTDPSDQPDLIDNDGDGQIDEATGHGTHIAGIVSLVAPASRLLVLRVLDSDGHGTAYNVARAIEYAAAHGATVLNASLGMLVESPAVSEAIRYAYARGVVFVAPAGNWGAEEPEEYPASDDRVWAVAATDGTGRPAPFTSFSGHVVISAPGSHIRSSYWNGGYALWSGTSMSAPFVAGTAALLREMHPDWTNALLLHRIQTTSDAVIPLNSEQIGNLGAGRLNVGSSLAPDGITISSAE